MFGKKIEVNDIRTAFKIVPIATVVIGITKPFRRTVSVKNPNAYPIIVRIRQLKPNGMPVIKSRMIPPVKPVISPKVLPFNNEK